MVTPIDLTLEFAKLTMLQHRTPASTAAEREGAFGQVAPYRDGALFTSKFAGKGAWERHRNGDELVHVIDGAATLHLMAEDGAQSFALGAGVVAIVPQGMWHRFESADGITLMTAMPQPTDHPTVDVEDARTISP